MQKKDYTTKEIAKLERVSERRIRAKLKQGHYPNAEKFGFVWKIPTKDVANRKQ